jgi:hypothetical protein
MKASLMASGLIWQVPGVINGSVKFVVACKTDR